MSREPGDSRRLAEVKEASTFIQNFHQKYYADYTKLLNSKDINQQAQGACQLLEIDFHDIFQEKTTDRWEKIIESSFRQASLRYHSDKNPGNKKKADDIFNLVNVAKVILSNIAQNPSILDKKQLLEQHPYLPNHQYELADGYKVDEWYYCRLANSYESVDVYKNWEFSHQKHTLSIKSIGKLSSETSITLYKPKLIATKKSERKPIKMPGYKAFFHLYVARATPHFSQIARKKILDTFKNNLKLGTAAAWLPRQALREARFIGTLRPNELVSLSDLGPTNTFIHYYVNHPDSIWGFKSFFNLPGFYKDTAFKTILSKPNNLTFMGSSEIEALIDASDKLREYIFSKKSLFSKISSFYLHAKIFFPVFKEDTYNPKKIEHISMQQLLFGNIGFLGFFSKAFTQKLVNIVTGNTIYLPKFVIDDIKLADKQRLSNIMRLDTSSTTLEFINIKELIKTLFLINHETEILYLLNKDALMWLSEEPEVHFSSFLPIIDALNQLGEKGEENELKNKFSTRLGKIEQRSDFSEQSNLEKKLKEAHEKWRGKQSQPVLEKYKVALENGDENNCKKYYRHLSLLNSDPQVKKIKQENFNAIKAKAIRLIKQLAAGENNERLKASFITIRQGLKNLGPGWGFDFFSTCSLEAKVPILSRELFILIGKLVEINLSSTYNRPTKNYGQFKEIYGVKKEAGTIENLRQLYFSCECLLSASHFYKNIVDTTFANRIGSFRGLEIFDEDAILKHLSAYAENELVVYLNGNREQLHYKKGGGRFYNESDIRKLDNIAIHYKKLGMGDHFEQLIPGAYANVLAAQQKYLASSNKGDRVISASQPIRRYIELRAHSKQINPQLEKLAARRQLYLIVGDIFTKKISTQKKPSFWDNNYYKNRTKFLDYFKKSDSFSYQLDLKSLEPANKEMLQLLKSYLINNSGSEDAKYLLEELRLDPVLQDYLGFSCLTMQQGKTSKQRIKNWANAVDKEQLLLTSSSSTIGQPSSAIFARESRKELNPRSEAKHAQVSKNKEIDLLSKKIQQLIREGLVLGLSKTANANKQLIIRFLIEKLSADTETASTLLANAARVLSYSSSGANKCSISKDSFRVAEKKLNTARHMLKISVHEWRSFLAGEPVTSSLFRYCKTYGFFTAIIKQGTIDPETPLTESYQRHY